MKIGIDATSITKEKITGVENYVRNFIIELAKIDTEDQFLLYMPDKPYNFPALPKNFHIISSPHGRFWTQRQLPKMINCSKPDVVFFPSNIIPRGIQSKIVYHFHDLAWKKFPKAYSTSEILRQRLAILRLRKANHIITASNSARDDLATTFGIEKKKIFVVPLGYDPKIANFAKEISDRSGFIFCGRLEPRKNIMNILKAFEMFAKKTGTKESLILCGSPGYDYRSTKKEIERLQRDKLNIVEENYLPPEEFYSILGESIALIYPSLYEGFGLPILEAFAAKTPVVTSNISSMPEVAGNAAILVDPTRPQEIASALEQVTDNTIRSVLVEKGESRLKHYSWAETAKNILAVLKNA